MIATQKLIYAKQLKLRNEYLKTKIRFKKLNNDILLVKVAKIVTFFETFFKKFVIKTQKNKSNVYESDNYLKCDSYFIIMKNQFRLNNVLRRDDMNSTKIDFVVIFLKKTSRQK